MTTSVLLPDSTVVHLNSESSLRYPTFFAGDVRQVELNGEAYFDVTQHPRKRFIVSTPHHSQVEVYGTSFNVEAYGNETPISTTLIEGSVGFIYKNSKGKFQKSMLSPRQKLVYSPQTGDIKCYATSGESEIHGKTASLSLMTLRWMKCCTCLESGSMWNSYCPTRAERLFVHRNIHPSASRAYYGIFPDFFPHTLALH